MFNKYGNRPIPGKTKIGIPEKTINTNQYLIPFNMATSGIPLEDQLKKISKLRAYLMVFIIALLFTLVFASAVAYAVFIQPTYGDTYANIFFMVCFTVIFFSLMYIYHIWITKIYGKED
jgi:lipopolysaccharide export LptBFGC system permease protein LptF